MSGLPRPTVRLRLTLLYGGLFLLSGAALLGINYALTARLTRPPDAACVIRVPDPALARERAALEGPGIAPLAPAPQPGVPCPEGPEQSFPGAHSDALPAGPAAVEIDGRSPLEFLRDQQDRTLRRLLAQSAVALAVMALVSVGLGWYLAGRVLRPLHDITSAAKRISIDDLHQRIALDGPADELQELADTFDAMLERLEAALVSQRRFVADASHELRTPLAVMRTELEVTLADEDADADELRRMAGTVRDAVARSELLVHSLLVLARSERDVALDEDVDLGEVAANAAAAAGAEAEASHMSLVTELWPARVRGDSALLERLVDNLVENGVRHGRPGGIVHVSTSMPSGVPTLEVANDGPIVDTADADRMFEPFVRLGQQRTGTGIGLGLAIVRAVAAAHGATLRAVPRAQGGLHMTVSFPQSKAVASPA